MSADTPSDRTEPMAPDPVPPCLRLQVAARMAQQLEARICRGSPVPPPLLGVLLTVARSPGIRQGLAADTLGFDATTFGRYVDRLVREGLVTRTVPPKDRRAISLSVTPEGAAEAKRCRRLEDELDAEVRARMGDADWNELKGLLTRFLAAFDHPLPMLGESGMVAED